MGRLRSGELLKFKLHRPLRNWIGKGVGMGMIHKNAPSLQAGAQRGLSVIGACGKIANDERDYSMAKR